MPLNEMLGSSLAPWLNAKYNFFLFFPSLSYFRQKGNEMKLNLKIVGKSKTEILETMQELLDEFSWNWVASNSFTDHANGTLSDYDFTDGTTIEDDQNEKELNP